MAVSLGAQHCDQQIRRLSAIDELVAHHRAAYRDVTLSGIRHTDIREPKMLISSILATLTSLVNGLL